eukprot:6194720-Pleurochrysis_carterae.AAC.5
MRLNYDLPLSSQDELRRNPVLNEKVVQWELGAAPLNQLVWGETPQEEMLAAADVVDPSSDNAPVAATPAEAVEPALQAPDWTNDSTTDDAEIWKTTPEDQMQDPQMRFIRESCTALREDQETWSRQRARTAREHVQVHVLDSYGLVYRLTKYGPRVLVPRQRCFALVHSCDRLLETGGHQGAAASMANRLGQHYFWEGMLTHYEQMCQHCQVCRNRDLTSSGGAVATQVLKDSPFPFHTYLYALITKL